MFSACRFIAVLIPTRSPLMFRSGPPELPGLIEASVWIRLRKLSPEAWMSRCSPEMIPVLTVCVWP